MKTFYYCLLSIITLFYVSGCTKEQKKQNCKQNPTNTDFTGDAVFDNVNSGTASFLYTANVTNVCEYLTAQISINVSCNADSVMVFAWVSVPGNSELGIPMSEDGSGLYKSGPYTLNPRQGNQNPTSYFVVVRINFPAVDATDAVNKYTRLVHKIDVNNNSYEPGE